VFLESPRTQTRQLPLAICKVVFEWEGSVGTWPVCHGPGTDCPMSSTLSLRLAPPQVKFQGLMRLRDRHFLCSVPPRAIFMGTNCHAALAKNYKKTAVVAFAHWRAFSIRTLTLIIPKFRALSLLAWHPSPSFSPPRHSLFSVSAKPCQSRGDHVDRASIFSFTRLILALTTQSPLTGLHSGTEITRLFLER
jgi:hypothetical protein